VIGVVQVDIEIIIVESVLTGMAIGVLISYLPMLRRMMHMQKVVNEINEYLMERLKTNDSNTENAPT
jgi:uncharacterized membrane protein (DUF106 family)